MEALVSFAAIIGLVYYIRKKINERPERRRRSSYRNRASVNPPRPVNARTERAAATPPAAASPRPVTSSTPQTPVSSSERYGQTTAILEYFANNPRNLSDNWFSFEFIKVTNQWRAYIERMPSLGERESDGHTTHHYVDSENNRWYVCFDPMPTTLVESQNIARNWADHILEYIATGQTF